MTIISSTSNSDVSEWVTNTCLKHLWDYYSDEDLPNATEVIIDAPTNNQLIVSPVNNDGCIRRIRVAFESVLLFESTYLKVDDFDANHSDAEAFSNIIDKSIVGRSFTVSKCNSYAKPGIIKIIPVIPGPLHDTKIPSATRNAFCDFFHDVLIASRKETVIVAQAWEVTLNENLQSADTYLNQQFKMLYMPH